ncbi:helix-turn-helix transcriptional regulator [Nonomuraea sp. NPDC050790]|uniref:helix-turn-helix transcriptional regulator n=1 Tax=Nonomuraea sp. NPDC050790 TaxID=3364371 RepID=UPI00378CC0C9
MAALPAPHRPAAELTSRRILVDPDRWLAAPRPDSDLAALHTAVFTDLRLRIRYRHSDQPAPHTYTVDPYGLVAKAGTWYLVADHRGKPRLYRADRVSAVTLAAAEVRRRPGVELDQVWHELRRQVEDRRGGITVDLRVRRQRLDMVTRIAGAFFTGPPTPADGEPEWTNAQVSYPVIEAVRHLLQFGTAVEVTGPPEARAEMHRASTEISALYDTDAERAQRL